MGTAYRQSIDCIIKSQKRVLRIICKADRLSHKNELFQRLKLLKFQDLVDFKIAIIMYRANKNDLPQSVQKHFVYANNMYSLRQMGNLKKNLIRTTRKSQCISIYGVRLYNEFNAELKNAKNINRFKIAFKRQVYFKYNSHN